MPRLDFPRLWRHTVVDEESLVAAGHKVAGLLVGAITNLCRDASAMVSCDKIFPNLSSHTIVIPSLSTPWRVVPWA